MKKISILFVLIGSLLLSGCHKYIRVTRTVTKTVNLPFNINQVGNFNSTSIVDARTIVNLFSNDGSDVYDSRIDEVDIQGISMGATLGSSNTANQLKLGAILYTNDGSSILLNDSKVIQITSSGAADFLNVIGNLVGVDKNKITLRNAIELVNQAGIGKLKKALKDNLTNINNDIRVTLNGTVPQNQRLVMNLTVQITATITYTTCEDTGIPFLGYDDDNCQHGVF